MGKMNKGILDEFSGTIGTVVGGNWRGIPYMRSKSRKRTNAKTDKQLEQQAKFSVASKLTQSMSELLTLGFRDQAIRMTGPNYALSQILNTAIIGTNPNFEIDYSKVEISKGKLPKAKNPAVAAGATGIIQFTWTNNAAKSDAKETDQALLVAYCPELVETEFIIGAQRSAGTGTLDVSEFIGKEVHTWISFMSANGKLLATSVYTGKVMVT